MTGCGLVDGFGGRIRYLRLSVTDRCDLRCVYCMAEAMIARNGAPALARHMSALGG